MFQYKHSNDTKQIEREFGHSVEIQMKYQIMLSDRHDSRDGWVLGSSGEIVFKGLL